MDKTDFDLLQLNPSHELVDMGRKPVCIPLEDTELTRLPNSETNLVVCNGPCRSCGGVVVQRLQIQLLVARAAGDVAVAVPKGSLCWVLVRLFLFYLSNRPISDGFREVVGDAVDTTTFSVGQRGRCISLQSGQGVDSMGLYIWEV